MRIIPNEAGSEFEVLSDSGNTYTVCYCGSGDGDPEVVCLWECDCPAGRHGRLCRHARAVADFCDEQDW